MEAAMTAIGAREDSKATVAPTIPEASKAPKAAGQNIPIQVSTQDEPSWVAILRRQPMNNLHRLGLS